MQDINLLPWREQQRVQIKKNFIILIVFGFIFSISGVWLIHCYLSGLTLFQLSRNNLLQQELNHKRLILKQIKSYQKQKNSIISKLLTVQELQSDKSLTVHLLYNLISIIPDGVYLSKLVKRNKQVSLWGYAESQSQIATLMIGLEHNAWIKDPLLTEIKKIDTTSKNGKNAFQLHFILKSI